MLVTKRAPASELCSSEAVYMKCLFFPRESDRRAMPRFSLQGRLRVVPHDNEALRIDLRLDDKEKRPFG